MSLRTIRWFAIIFLSAFASSTALAQISLVSQLNPAPGIFYGDVWGEGDYAYLGSADYNGAGVFIIDISDPAQPQLAAEYAPTDDFFLQDVKVQDGIGYFASNSGGDVHIVDLADPTQPVLLSRIDVINAHNVSVNGDFLYVAPGFGGIFVYDVSQPASPTFVRQFMVPGGGPHDVTALGNRLYASSFDGGTSIYDVTNISPTVEPELLGVVPSGASSHSNWVTNDGNTLVSARERSNGDVTLFDITDLSDVSLLARFQRGQLGIRAFSPHNPVIMDDILYVSWYQAGLQVFDISDPANPNYLGGYDTFPGPNAAGFAGNWGVYPFLGTDRILLSDTEGGLFIVDVSNVVPEPCSAVLALLAVFLCASRRSATCLPVGVPGGNPDARK